MSIQNTLDNAWVIFLALLIIAGYLSGIYRARKSKKEKNARTVTGGFDAGKYGTITSKYTASCSDGFYAGGGGHLISDGCQAYPPLVSFNTSSEDASATGSTLKVMRGPGGGLYLSGAEDLREGDVFRREVRS